MISGNEADFIILQQAYMKDSPEIEFNFRIRNINRVYWHIQESSHTNRFMASAKG